MASLQVLSKHKGEKFQITVLIDLVQEVKCVEHEAWQTNGEYQLSVLC
jgi:hypothetical protein